jgi:spore germination protein GerM
MDDKIKREYYSSIATQDEFTTSDKLLKLTCQKGIRTLHFKDEFVGSIESTTASDSVLATLLTSYEKILRENIALKSKKS